jgi:phosphoglycolate phosphatase
MFKNIIFDWTGVVKDFLEGHLWLVNRIFENYGVDKISSEELKENWIQPYMVFYEKYVPSITKEEQDKLFFEAITSKDCPKSTQYPGIVKLIKELKNRGSFLAILSSDLPVTILPEIKEFGLENVFDDKIISVHNKKEGLLELIYKNKLDLNRTILVGDSNHEVEIAKELDIKSVAVTWGVSSERNLKKSNPDYLVHNVNELEKILLS